MAEIERKMMVCDFCINAHRHYMPDAPFNYWKKEGVALCSICSDCNVMCAECYAQSLIELKGSVLLKFGFAICGWCIPLRRTSDLQEKFEIVAKQRIEEAQKLMREDAVYIVTKKLQWQL